MAGQQSVHKYTSRDARLLLCPTPVAHGLSIAHSGLWTLTPVCLQSKYPRQICPQTYSPGDASFDDQESESAPVLHRRCKHILSHRHTNRTFTGPLIGLPSPVPLVLCSTPTSAMSDVSDSSPPLDAYTLLQIGPPFIGDLLAYLLFGIAIVQLYIYHTSFSRDHIAIRAAVYGIFLLDVFQTIIVGVAGWQIFVSGWGRITNLEYPGWSFPATPIVSVTISVSVQTFYAWRIWRLGQWRVVPLAIIAAGLASATGAFIFSILFMFKKNIDTFHEKVMYSLTIVWLGVGAFADILIMLSMFYLLYTAKRRVKHFERSELLVNRLMRLTVETGLACALTALLELSLFLGLPQTNVHIMFATFLSKVYANTFMASLNSRAASSRETTGGTISFGSHARPTGSGQLSSGSNPPLTIHITQEVDKNQGWELELNDLSTSERHTTSVPGKRGAGTGSL